MNIWTASKSKNIQRIILNHHGRKINSRYNNIWDNKDEELKLN